MAGSFTSSLVVVVILTVCCVTAVKSERRVPSYVTPCSRNDPNLNECALRSGRIAIASVATKGDRKYNIPVLDPMLITAVTIQQTGISINNTDIVVTGMKDVDLTAVRIDLKNQHEEFDFIIPLLDIRARYNIVGRILVVPILGNGTANLTLTGIKVTLKNDYKLVRKKKNGKLYMNIYNTTLTSSPTSMTVSMDGLFNGDKRLGDNMNKFMNDNWRDIYGELGPAYDLALTKIADQIYNGVASVLNYDDMFPDNKV